MNIQTLSSDFDRAQESVLARQDVSPNEAMQLIPCGRTKLYALIKAGEIVAYHDGKSCRITLASIRARRARLLAAAGHAQP